MAISQMPAVERRILAANPPELAGASEKSVELITASQIVLKI